MGIILVLGLTACGAAEQPDTTLETETVTATEESKETSDTSEEPTSESEDMQTEIEDSSVQTETGSDVLVAYFSATGTTKGVAEKIASIEGADVYEITAAEPYSDADLNWNDSNSRTTKEQNDKSVRPEIGSEKLDLTGYTKIYIGYPIWWGEEPRIMDTFVEGYDFGNIKMIPFCTSGGSGIGSSGKNLAENAGSGNWIEGDRLNGNISEEELKSWIEGLE
ncbi:MAG: flavodoxin [Eubacterium sp.]|nr:flavodoxin [Eubacterium sp.]